MKNYTSYKIQNILKSNMNVKDIYAQLNPLLRIENNLLDEFEEDGSLTDSAYTALQEFLLDIDT